MIREEYEGCNGDDRKEIEFIEKYDGSGPSSAILNCGKSKNPGLFKKMIKSCGSAAISNPYPTRK